jgi:hypothetical protein
MKLRIILIIAGLFLAGCWYTTFPEDSNPDCRKNTYGFLIFHTSNENCAQSSPTATPTPSP